MSRRAKGENRRNNKPKPNNNKHDEHSNNYDLFDDLLRATGAPNISDMHYPPYHERAICVLAKKGAGGGYSLHEWNDALEYLLFHEGCATEEEAWQVFVEAAKRL